VRYYPVNLDIRDRPCLVVGGGGVGTRKAQMLLECGARVTVVSPLASARLEELAGLARLKLQRRPYEMDDLTGCFLVIGATDDEALNRRIHADAEARGMLCNIADRPEACNFILPAIVRRGDLVLAISTSGRSPAFAKHLRRRLEKDFGPEYAIFLDLMGRIRERLLATEHAPEAHKPLFERLIAGDLVELIRQQDRSAIDRLLASVVGPEFRFDTLMQTPCEKSSMVDA